MIDSTSSFDRASRIPSVPGDTPAPGSGRQVQITDRLQTDKAEQLSAALASQPEIRPDVVARGQLLAADPSYPSAAVISRVAAMIVNSPDLSEDQS
jgi:hypothetical protein